MSPYCIHNEQKNNPKNKLILYMNTKYSIWSTNHCFVHEYSDWKFNNYYFILIQKQLSAIKTSILVYNND